MKYRLLFLVLAGVFLLSAASAANANFTPIFDVTDQVHVNQSYKMYDQNATAFPEWLFEVTLGMLLFILSCYFSTKPECRDIDTLFSMMSCLPLFVAAFTSVAVDVVTGYGVAGTVVNNVQYYAMLENHTIYHFDITGIVLWIFSFISILNTIRIYINHKRFDKMFGSGPQ